VNCKTNEKGGSRSIDRFRRTSNLQRGLPTIPVEGIAPPLSVCRWCYGKDLFGALLREVSGLFASLVGLSGCVRTPFLLGDTSRVGGEAQRITQFRAIAQRLEMPQRRVYLLCLLVKRTFLPSL
jgi:hypothetical protein